MQGEGDADNETTDGLAQIAVLGLGEVGCVYGSALASRGHPVVGYDPAAVESPAGVTLADTVEQAVDRADIVLTLTSAAASVSVAAVVAPVIRDRAVYADFTSSGPSVKQAVARSFSARPEVAVADVAILGPVIQQGISTPLMAAGPGAPAVAELMTAVGAPVEVIQGPPGDAMSHKLLRSIFMKGLASVVIEAVQAGHATGKEAWIRDQIAAMLADDGQMVIDRFLTGTRKHAGRRAEEMRATSAYLADLGVPHEMSLASAEAHERMRAEASVRTTS